VNPLLAARKELGMSQSLLSAKLGCSRTHLFEMESGSKPLDSKALAFLATFPRRVVATPEKSDISRTSKPVKLNRLQRQNLRREPGHGCRRAEWEKWWFSVTNPVCVPCTRTCKQSAMVRIISCPQREVKDDTD
jgi:transcriptional regulator with XRE-family HTH domain